MKKTIHSKVMVIANKLVKQGYNRANAMVKAFKGLLPCLLNAFYICFHTVGAIPLHLIGDMPVCLCQVIHKK